MENQDDEGGGHADHDGDEDGGQEVPGVCLGVQLRDGEAGVGPGVVAGDDGVGDGRDVEPGVADHGGGVAARSDVDLQTDDDY